MSRPSHDGAALPRIDVHREVAGLTQRIAVRALFGGDAGLTPFLPPWVRTPGRRRMRAAVAVLDRETEHVTRKHETASAAGREDPGTAAGW
ncbi:hypothetical protein [Streptomyces sp. G-G2]|uniref:hypothetical protein n=1 Tax=Streptomyces sp. G-G2 TaxID=3046201 RepID=UPI0024BB7BC2|nr:hypothetical protein [Streptomyces sp. G-G2]MDJ0381123.1 hypothetical protein [Streptomyces sp. G-G2]